MWASQKRVLLIMTCFSTELTCILLSHILISWSQFTRVCCLCLDEMYIGLVLETFNDMLFELHQDKTVCKSVVKVSTNVSIEWLDLPIVVSSANMSAQVLVSERGRSFCYHTIQFVNIGTHVTLFYVTHVLCNWTCILLWSFENGISF